MHAPGDGPATGRVARLLTPALALGSVLYRLLPAAVRLPNFAPVGGTALYAGARLPLGAALAWPFASLVVCDLALWFFRGDSPFIWPVYAGFAGYVLLGRWLLRGSDSRVRVGAASVLASGWFFAVTNLACWLPGQMYPLTAAGLVECYTMALPFLAGTVVGDLLFSQAVFALAAVLERRSAAAAEGVAS